MYTCKKRFYYSFSLLKYRYEISIVDISTLWKNIDIDIDMVILENIDIHKAILQNIDIDKISNRFKFGISNRATVMWHVQIQPVYDSWSDSIHHSCHRNTCYNLPTSGPRCSLNLRQVRCSIILIMFRITRRSAFVMSCNSRKTSF